MIIKDDKVVEPVPEQVSENPPPYSPALPARVQGVANPNVPAALRPGYPGSYPQFGDQNQNHNTVVFRPRGASSASSRAASSAGGGGASAGPGSGSSGSSVYSNTATGSRSVVAATSSSVTIRPADPYPLVPPPSDIPRTSYLHIKRRNGPISARVVLDPYLPRPLNPRIDVGEEGNENSSWNADEDDDYGPRFGSGSGSSLPGVDAGDSDKRNVCLMSKNANINAEMWVVGRPPDDGSDDSSVYGRKKAGIDIRSKDGFIRVKLHAHQSSPPFSLRIACKNGGVRVVLPRSFSGPLITRTGNGWVTLSPELANITTTFTEVRGVRKSFIGEFLDSGYGRGEWPGSALDITCENGRIKLCYLDEDTEKSTSASTGDKRFFNRVFN